MKAIKWLDSLEDRFLGEIHSAMDVYENASIQVSLGFNQGVFHATQESDDTGKRGGECEVPELR